MVKELNRFKLLTEHQTSFLIANSNSVFFCHQQGLMSVYRAIQNCNWQQSVDWQHSKATIPVRLSTRGGEGSSLGYTTSQWDPIVVKRKFDNEGTIEGGTEISPVSKVCEFLPKRYKPPQSTQSRTAKIQSTKKKGLQHKRKVVVCTAKKNMRCLPVTDSGSCRSRKGIVQDMSKLSST